MFYESHLSYDVWCNNLIYLNTALNLFWPIYWNRQYWSECPWSLSVSLVSFQAMLDGDVTSNQSSSTDTTVIEKVPPIDTSQDVLDVFEEIVGTKCRAPFTHEWGEKTYGNALIAEVDDESNLETPKVISHYIASNTLKVTRSVKICLLYPMQTMLVRVFRN